eukprot:m51a1_g1177 putative alpha-amylase (455) ;mRNA; f:384449-386177
MAGLVYQIFPDRFARDMGYHHGIQDGGWVYKGRPISFAENCYDPRLTSDEHQTCFFGGNLRGVISKLDYLKDFGVTIVYLTPIFEARTTHRYEAVDYLRIDPILGTMEDFERLVKGLHARGMQLYLDLVFNHNSRDSDWHRDPATRRTHYLLQRETPAGGPVAMTWFGMPEELPKLDTGCAAVREHLLGVVAHWRHKGADGFRVDAAHLLPHELLQGMRKAAEGAPIVVEDWQYAPYYFEDGSADGITNMLLSQQLGDFFIENCSPSTMLDRLLTWAGPRGYPANALRHTWNLIENHDTCRFRSRTVDGGRSKALAALAVAYVLPGVPLLYQGTERGNMACSRLKGELEARLPVDWSTHDSAVMDFVRKLGAIRGNARYASALAGGSMVRVDAEERSRTFVFDRRGQQGVWIRCAVNDGYWAYERPWGTLQPHSVALFEVDPADQAHPKELVRM